MGIRIHKCIGYALTDVKFVKNGIYRPNDDRIREEAIREIHDGIHDSRSLKSYKKYLQDQIDLLNADSYEAGELKLEKDSFDKGWEPYKSLIYDAEYGLGNVLLITDPQQHSSWMRYDDLIDWVEANIDWNPKSINYIRRLDNGIYPYNGFSMDTRTGQVLHGETPQKYHYLKEALPRAEKAKDERASKQLRRLMNKLAKEMGFKNAAFADAHMAPMIPDSIVHFCKWANIFTNESVIWQLRPTLYVYWS